MLSTWCSQVAVLEHEVVGALEPKAVLELFAQLCCAGAIEDAAAMVVVVEPNEGMRLVPSLLF